MNAVKKVAVITAAATLGAAAFTTTAAFAKFLPSTHLQPSSPPTGAVGGHVFNPGLPGTAGSFAPSFPSGSSPPPPPPPPPPPNCQLNPGACRG